MGASFLIYTDQSVLGNGDVPTAKESRQDFPNHFASSIS